MSGYDQELTRHTRLEINRRPTLLFTNWVGLCEVQWIGSTIIQPFHSVDKDMGITMKRRLRATTNAFSDCRVMSSA